MGAFDTTAHAANSGDVAAQAALGDMYLQGAGVPASFAAASVWLNRAATSGDAPSMVKLAKLKLAGRGLQDTIFERPSKPDREGALRWAAAAAAAGLPEGKSLLAVLLDDDDSRGAQTRQTIRTLIDEAAAEGDPSACLQKAVRLRQRNEGEPEAVVSLLARAAEGNMPMAIYLLGIATEIGFGAKREGLTAVRLYQRAAELGLRPAQLRLGCALLDGKYLKRNVVQAETWLRKASAAGDGRAMALIGDLRAGGDGLPTNYEEAASWFERAASAGDLSATRLIVLLRFLGLGVAQDTRAAADAIALSQRLQPNVSSDPASLLAEDGVRLSVTIEAAQWFEKDARSGSPVAAYQLGMCLALGTDGNQNCEAAAEWLRRASPIVPMAALRYGQLLLAGRGVARDEIAGRLFLAKAADAGIEEAQILLAALPVAEDGLKNLETKRSHVFGAGVDHADAGLITQLHAA